MAHTAGGPRLTSGRGTSKQDYETPPEFMAAVTARFGPVVFDLAADQRNAKAPRFFSESDDALVKNWETLPAGLKWLNPPFAKIAPWALKCWREGRRGVEVALLTPAAVGANWMRDSVLGCADVYLLSGRITFVGTGNPYPKDCALSYFGPTARGRIFVWNWRRNSVCREWRLG